MLTFGPVPSRRLGRSLGINNIPPKICSYSCVYCQVGRTLNMQVDRRTFYEPEAILREVREKMTTALKMGEKIDYLTFVPDGEPTLDENLGSTIDLLKPLGIKIAVITNGSLIWREDVRQGLMNADWVSLKVDAAVERVWRTTNRPQRGLDLDALFGGMLEFKRKFPGQLMSETMLAKEVNDGEENLEAVADFLGRLRPVRAYLSIPTRPPAERWVHPPDEDTVNRAYQILSTKVDHVEYLIGYEGDAFAFTGNTEEDLLNITAVHPMRREAVSEYLSKAGSSWSVVRSLLERGRLIETAYDGREFYVRRFPKRASRTEG